MMFTAKANIKLLIIVAALIITLPLALACNKQEVPKPAEPAQATAVPQPITGKKAEPGTGQSDYSVDELIKNWPKDVPLMEPYKIKGFLPEYEGFRQISILLNSTMNDVYSYYADNLFGKGGWQPVDGSKAGVPDVFLSFKCRKDNRELDVMLKSEQEGEQTLIQLGLTDLTKHKKKPE